MYTTYQPSRYRCGIHRLVHERVGNTAGAEDLSAEVFIATLRPLRLLASVPEVRAYLVSAHRALRHARQVDRGAAGRAAGGEGPVVFESHGMALWDVAAATTVLAAARERGAGEEIGLFR